MKKFLTTLFALLVLSTTNLVVTVLANNYDCPLPGKAPVDVDIPDSHDITKKFKVVVGNSEKDQVCILYRVTAKDASVDIDSFSNKSESSHFILEPVARSYHKKNWQAVAGPYSASVKVKECVQKVCTFRFPVVKTDESKYVFMTFEHKLESVEAERARFLSRTTFGPTLEDIRNWPYGEGLKSFADYIQAQIDLPMTSWRAFWRERLDFSLSKGHEGMGLEGMHPCDQYSRWTDRAINVYDKHPFINITKVDPNDPNSKLLMSYSDGEPLTVIDEFAPRSLPHGSKLNCTKEEVAPYCGEGQYRIVLNHFDTLNGLITYHPTSGATNIGRVFLINPLIVLPDSIINNPNAMKPMKLITLPNESEMQFLNGADTRNRQKVQATYRLMSDNWSGNEDKCNGFKNEQGKWYFYNILGKVGDTGKILKYTPYARFRDNTVENPLPDGGALKFDHPQTHNCITSIPDFTNIHSCRLSNGVGCVPRFLEMQQNTRETAESVLVCGAHGEVGHDPGFEDKAVDNAFRLSYHALNRLPWGGQWNNVWSTVLFESKDQLRQRIAWALSQIFVINKSSIGEEGSGNEHLLHYHDIFIRNAFGNYRDIIKEVSFSPLMGEMLTYIGGISAPRKYLHDQTIIEDPDENFAREVMQLFTIGLYKLDMSGNVLLNKKGFPIPTYKNQDVQNFARAWTGFTYSSRRDNLEGRPYFPNRINPMFLIGPRRDQFPKTDLHGGFIGDRYPECGALPKKQFLKIGAKYRLLGSINFPYMHWEGQYEAGRRVYPWRKSPNFKRLELQESSALYQKLCNSANSNGSCNYSVEVELDANLECDGEECDIDNPIVVMIQDDPPIYYEYLKPACVDLVFQESTDLAMIVDPYSSTMCLNKNDIDVAMPVCCDDPTVVKMNCMFSVERTSYHTAMERCQVCDFELLGSKRPQIQFQPGCHFQGVKTSGFRRWWWTDAGCAPMQLRVRQDSFISAIHNPIIKEDSLHQLELAVNSTNINYFPVHWKKNNYPKPSKQCNGICVLEEDTCLCSVEISRDAVFTGSLPTTSNECLQLKIGAPNPLSLGDEYIEQTGANAEVRVWFHTNELELTKNSIFSFVHNEHRVFVRNAESLVSIPGSDFSFRNPPSLMRLAYPDTRDAYYETDAVIDELFYHENTPTFVAMSLLKRFGFSNPSPSFIETVSKAFATGMFVKRKKGISIGSGRRGDLAATVAAILLDKEGKTPVLDADPSSGALKEPAMKYLHLMRSMEFRKHPDKAAPSINFGWSGQQAFGAPSVFSFFLPDYSPKGQMASSSLSAPEAELLDTPRITGIMNGMLTLIDMGLNSCIFGWGAKTFNCDAIYNAIYAWNRTDKADGLLSYEPAVDMSAEEIIDELALVLTDGRLNKASRKYIANAYREDYVKTNNTKTSSIRLAQKLVLLTPEFHSTNVVKSTKKHRPQFQAGTSEKPYKAIVVLNLWGGADSYNMLMPHSNCKQEDAYELYKLSSGSMAIGKDQMHTISVQNQDCETMAVHPNFYSLRDMYNDKDLSFIGNLGMLQESRVNKRNWGRKHKKIQLFAHDKMHQETLKMDIFDDGKGTGLGGRIADVLSDRSKGYDFVPNVISTSGNSFFTRADTVDTITTYGSGYVKIASSPNIPRYTSTHNVDNHILNLNNATRAGSSFYADIWSDTVYHTLGENRFLHDTINKATLNTQFPPSYGALANVAKLISTREERGADRDVIYANIMGWDMHFPSREQLDSWLHRLNNEVIGFKNEMLAQGIWDDVVVVEMSEFGRTFSSADHGWGGNYFIAGGQVDGGKVHGTFIEKMTGDHPLVFRPGVTIPTTPWESVWNGVAKWFGVKEEDLDQILPNRWKFSADLMWNTTDLFKNV